MKRDARIEFRIPEETKARWQAAADGLGYPSLSSMIVDTVENAHFPPSISEGGSLVEFIFTNVTETGGRLTPAKLEEYGKQQVKPDVDTAGLTGKLTVDSEIRKQLKVPGSDTRECPKSASHRKGTFCKGCKKVITK